jgi:solute carrier family 13 (sodium-dependent dicarboxylate transporter), member 2/3/5
VIAPPLPLHGVYALGIMAFAVVLWVTEVVPFAVTALFVLLLVPAFGIADYRTVVKSGFGDPIITFFIGVLILSAAFTRSGLGTRLVHHVLARVGTRTDRVLLGLLVVGVLISMWITKMAVAAMLVPVGTGLLTQAGVERGRSNFGRAIMIATAFGPLIGGIATPAGTGANLVAIAQLKQLAQTDVSFGRWMLYGVPACALMVPVAWKLLLYLFPPELSTIGMTDADARARLRDIGPLSRDERWTLVIFGTAIALWILAPPVQTWTRGRIALPAEAIGLGAGLSLFLPGVRVLTWKDAQRDIDWGGIVLIAAGLSLGAVIYDTGAARWLAWLLLGRVTMVPILLRPLVIVLGVSALRLMFSSNTVAAAIITPILVALAHDLRLDAWGVVAPAAFAATMGFVLVSQGPTTIIPYGAGYFSIKDMAKAGVCMTFAAAVCVAIPGAVLQLLGPAPIAAADVAAGAFERNTALSAFCRAEVTLTPTDDSRIDVEVWMPAAWNGKLQAVGNRGWGDTDNPRVAMQVYLEWEYGLVAQLERDGTHGFTVLT